MNFDISKHNVGKTDRMIRAIVGVLLILGAFRGGSWVVGVIGAVLIGTAFLRFCPAYKAFDYSTDKGETPAAK